MPKSEEPFNHEEFEKFATKELGLDSPSTEDSKETEPTEENLDIYFGELPPFEVRVVIDSDGKIKEFLDDLEHDGFISYGKNSFEEVKKVLDSVGVEMEYQPWTVNDGEDCEGWIFIEKAQLNEAIKNGKLVIEKSDDGDIEIN